MPKNPHADFTPALEGYSGQGKFRFWCQMALPLTYDDSLSYYELLCKVVNYLNHTIEDVANAETNVSRLAEAYTQLQTYVNDYFDNLDVEAELRNVLDAMAEDGTLDDLLDPLVQDHLPAVVDEQIDDVVADQIDDAVAGQIGDVVAEQLPPLVEEGIPGEVSDWLTENVDPVGSAVVVDSSLTISGAAADAKVTGDELTDLKTQISDIQEVIGIPQFDEFTAALTSNGWQLFSYPITANTTYIFKNTGSVVITANIYGETSGEYHPLYTGTGTSNINPGDSVSFTSEYDDNRLRIYMTTGNNGFAIAVDPNSGIIKEIADINSDIDTLEEDNTRLQSQLNILNEKQMIVTYNPSNTELHDGRIKAFTGEVTSTESVFSYIEIPVSQGDTITFIPESSGSGSSYGYAFYKSDYSYLTGGAPTVDVKTTITVPENAAYFRYSMNNPKWNDATYNTFDIVLLSTKNNMVNIVSHDVLCNLSGKTWNAIGDSITYQGRYIAEVKAITGITAINGGVGGSTIAINNSYLTAQSIVERVCGLNGNTPYDDADVWTVMGGLNDCYYSSPLGSISSPGSTFDNTTVYGALQSICEYILNLRAHPRLVLMTPTQSVRDTWSPTTYPTTMALIRKAIIDVGELYSVPVLDVWAEGGISLYNIQKATNPTTSDGVHINALGAEIVSPCIARAIKDTFFGV